MTNIQTDHATSPAATGCILVLCMRCGLRAYLKKRKTGGKRRGKRNRMKLEEGKKREDENGMMKWKGRTLTGKE